MTTTDNELQRPEGSALDDQSDRGVGRGDWYIALTGLLVIVLVAGGVLALLRGTAGPDPMDTRMGTTAATISLGELSPTGAGLYRAAADHGEHFAALPCYCGCDTTLAHRSLRDCFITASGDWDAHASGCEICTAEAVTALELLDAGVPAATVQAQIIDQYGPPPTDDITEPQTPSAAIIPVHPQLETLQ